MDQQIPEAASVVFRKPKIKDGANVWRLIKSHRHMDLNSAYSYLMLCKFFTDTCVVAEENGRIIGFMSAFRLPQSQDTLFVWQIAVHENHRGKGIGNKLLKELLSRDICENVHYVEATVSPSNAASRALFKGLAQELSCPYEINACFSADLFPESGHEAEEIFRIGPF